MLAEPFKPMGPDTRVTNVRRADGEPEDQTLTIQLENVLRAGAQSV
jgi:hypothetical protein